LVVVLAVPMQAVLAVVVIMILPVRAAQEQQDKDMQVVLETVPMVDTPLLEVAAQAVPEVLQQGQQQFGMGVRAGQV
jgi:hypothetical protein